VTREALGGWLAVSLGAWLLAHAALVAGLARRPPRWRAAVALVVPPLAPAWGWAMRGRVIAWSLALAAYAMGIAAAR
jgi:hypothetical protein